MNLVALKAELTTDPLSLGYAAMSDEQAANRLAVVDRPGDGAVSGLLLYLLTNKSRTNTGSDTVATSALGRVLIVSQAAIAANPFGANPTLPITLDLKCSALAFLEILRNPSIGSLPFQSDALRAILTDLVASGAIRATDRAAMIAIGDNQQSRAAELGLGVVTTSDVADARRLP
jgi:hypothetical protein